MQKLHFAAIEPPLLNCEAVISEACFLLRTPPDSARTLIDLLARGVVEIPFRLAEEADPVRRLLMRYASVPMALADTSLVRMAEQHAGSAILTLDHDFLVYRKKGRQVVPTIMPEVTRRRT